MVGMTKIATKEYLTSAEGLEEINRLVSEEHATYNELSRTFGISKPTLITWMKEEPTIRIAMQRGKILMKPLVEDSLYDLCFEKKVYRKAIKKDENNRIKESTIVEEVRSQSLSGIKYVLNNISNGEWKDRQDISIDAMMRVPKVIHDDIGIFTDDELIDGNTIITQQINEPHIDTQQSNEVANNGKSVETNGNRKKQSKTKALDEF